MWAIPFEIIALGDNDNEYVMTQVSSHTENIPITSMGNSEMNYIRGRTTWQIEIEEVR